MTSYNNHPHKLQGVLGGTLGPKNTIMTSRENFLFVWACVLFISLHINERNLSSLFAYAYTSSMPVQRTSQSTPRHHDHDERPLTPPFPNGPCDGTVITLPRRDLFPGQSDSNNLLPNLRINPFSSLENVVLPPRDVKVWLPQMYHQNRNQRFPVLYCHDGQNAMEDASSWTGSSWRLVGALTRLSERKMLHTGTPPIVVCIPCGEGDFLPGISRRHSEYGDYNHPVSEAHGDWTAKKLHPYIMSRFRIKDGPEHVSTIGSSLGGQASLQLVLRYPTIFGGAACLSPCFQPGTIAAVMANLVANDEVSTDISGLRTFQNERKPLSPESGLSEINPNSLRSKTIYIDNGGDADDIKVPFFDAHDHFTLNDKFWNPGYWWLDTSLQPMVDAMRWMLNQGGINYVYEKVPGARHNERAWAQRIHRPLLALYGKRN